MRNWANVRLVQNLEAYELTHIFDLRRASFSYQLQNTRPIIVMVNHQISKSRIAFFEECAHIVIHCKHDDKPYPWPDKNTMIKNEIYCNFEKLSSLNFKNIMVLSRLYIPNLFSTVQVMIVHCDNVYNTFSR